MRYIRVIAGFFFFFGFYLTNAQTWSGIGFGDKTGGGIQSIKAIDDKLYIGGGFVSPGGLNTSGIAIWNGSTWDSLGSGLDGMANSVEKYQNEIYAGGNFIYAEGVKRPRIARWDGNNWNSLGNKYPSQTVNAVKYKGELYIGGAFNELNDTDSSQLPGTVRRIAKWNGNNWSGVGGGVGGGTAQVETFTEYNGDLIVAGRFDCIGPSGSCNIAGYNIARWDGTQWFPLDSGLDGRVYDFAIDSVNNLLYAGGSFYGTASWGGNSTPLNFIGQWDGIKWSALQGDSILTNSILSLKIYHGYLYIGLACPNTEFYRFDGKNWELVESLDCAVVDMESYQDELYVGGVFSNIDGDTSMGYLAKWHTPNYCDSIHSSFTISADTVYFSDSAMVQCVPGGFANQYLWDFDASTSSTSSDTAQFPTYYYDSAGVYNIKLKAAFGFCPWDSAEKTIVVVNDVGIKELVDGGSQLKIYPNPASGSFTVEIQNENLKLLNAKLEIYDVKGKIVYQSQIQNLKSEIQTSQWKKGSYLVNIISEGKTVAEEKIVIE